MDRHEWDVIVIGGGPAGSAAATWIARAGLRVGVYEGQTFPRHHIGESLLSMSMSYVRELGIEDELAETGALRKYGSLFCWGGDPTPVVLGQGYPGYAYQVKRATFDDLLLKNAERAGAVVHLEHRIRSLIDEGGRVAGIIGRSPTGEFEARARVVVDATGLTQLIPRKLGLSIQVNGPRRLALSGYFTGAHRPTQHHPNDIVTEATNEGWIWFIPLDEELTSVGFVTDARPLDASTEQTLASEIASSTVVRGLTDGSRLVEPVRSLRYTNHIVTSPFWDRGYILVGDTAAFIDPLFSTGVHGALHSAALASAGITSTLGGGNEPAIAEWYDRRARAHFVRVHTMITLLYSINPGGGQFWRRRYKPQLSGRDAEDALVRLGPSGVAFFQQSMHCGALSVPEAIATRLGQFRHATKARRLAGDAVPRLADDIRRGTDLMRWRGQARAALTLTDPRHRVQRGEWPLGGVQAALLDAVDGRQTVDEIAAAAGHGDQRAHPAVFLGTLVEAGHLVAAARTRVST